ncbi:uncharacterized protein BYT42DRAFT_39884 [Radiomyces spectabilis]|uniref:uncharacterized protein n=1 Tax=Radiomyces spectabilis TaxID=64574 RepID=UPI00222005D2|nr:uncharacterized protein BYT42DRAFT_39884 [Radiomyces spectabilis]KAI8394302.1 hypothetical protein BYT42DRAFT_39884 [Radiomyces spectabilis]
MADEFDIYGDDTFDQTDDILDEIVGEPSARESKRRRTAQPPPRGADDDLFDDFGANVKDDKPQKQHNGRANSVQSDDYKHEYKHKPPHHMHDGSRSQDASPHKSPMSLPHSSSSHRSYVDPLSAKREPSLALANLRNVVNTPTSCIYIGELAWYITDEDVKAPLNNAGIGAEMKELTFFEHKVNGKSRGVCFAEFTSAEAASQAKEILETTEFGGKLPAVSFTTSTNPFKHLPKEPVSKTQRVQHTPRMNNSVPMMGANGGFNPMMGGFNPGFGGAMNMAYGGFPMAQAGYGMMQQNVRGRGGMRGGNPYMNRGASMMGRSGGNYMSEGAGFGGGMYINPAFFEQQQGGGGFGAQ